jgi:tRNA A37 threonylcarbamoyladenosine dehydratase
MNTFDPNTHIQSIVIVGCGGTGAQVARIVGRIVYDMQRARLHTPKIILIDPDIVEEKNVGRQLYMLRGIHYR